VFTLTINNLNNRYVVVFGRYLTRLAAKDERNLYLDLQRQHPFAFASKTWLFFTLFQFFTTGKQGYRGLVLMSLINYGKMQYRKVFFFGQETDAFPKEQRIVLSLQTM